jgi:hypothetical protein
MSAASETNSRRGRFAGGGVGGVGGGDLAGTRDLTDDRCLDAGDLDGTRGLDGNLSGDGFDGNLSGDRCLDAAERSNGEPQATMCPAGGAKCNVSLELSICTATPIKHSRWNLKQAHQFSGMPLAPTSTSGHHVTHYHSGLPHR